uniref:Uncharacterized protein n=1 Tax=Arundo donax TaxID=35708 RepID=A0A0A9DSE3_ARUDO
MLVAEFSSFFHSILLSVSCPSREDTCPFSRLTWCLNCLFSSSRVRFLSSRPWSLLLRSATHASPSLIISSSSEE